MRREQRDLRSMWRVNGAYEEIVRERCWFISVNFSQDRRSLCVLSFSEAITPRLCEKISALLNKLCDSINSAALREEIHTTLQEKNIFSRVFFLAKPQGSQRRSMNIVQRLSTTYALLATIFHDFSRLMLAIAR